MLRQWFNRYSTFVLGAEGIAFRQSKSHPIVNLTQGEFSQQKLLDDLEIHASKLKLKSVRFVLSNQYVRYLVLPAQTEVYALEDWQALAEHEFKAQFGAPAGKWNLTVSLQGFNQPVVACAIDKELLDRLLNISNQHGWQVDAVEPAITVVFNYFRKQFTQQNQWLLMTEHQRILLAQIQDGRWFQFYVESPFAGEESHVAKQMIERALRMQETSHVASVACFGVDRMLPKADSPNAPWVSLALPVKSDNPLNLLAVLA